MSSEFACGCDDCGTDAFLCDAKGECWEGVVVAQRRWMRREEVVEEVKKFEIGSLDVKCVSKPPIIQPSTFWRRCAQERAWKSM